MIDLYTWPTPNGRKISIMLEELGVDYTAHAINIGEGEQKTPEFLAIAPNNKIPAIVDHDNGLNLFESGAILIYLAEKYGKFLPTDPLKRAECIQWLMWQMGGLGPMLGQTHQYAHYNSGKALFAEERFLAETQRLYGVLNQRLEGRDYIVDDYSIADMAIAPWANMMEYYGTKDEVGFDDLKNVPAYVERFMSRPAVARARRIPDPS